uniref:Peptidase S1 domain-containing protein n=1 Tax=Glossina austeni TaxID=7395 RepID=A0A1A9V710_GLOAU
MIFIVKANGRTKYFGSENFCGGTIITPNYILTAAHCVGKMFEISLRFAQCTSVPVTVFSEGDDIKTIRVIAGTRRRLRRTANAQRRRVQRKIIHPEYPRSPGCDIAIMQLKTKLDIDGKHRAIAPLEFDEYPVLGQHCIAAGWGTIYNEGPCPNDILYVKMVVIVVEPSQILLHRPSEYAQAACSGDSGGPLFCRSDLFNGHRGKQSGESQGKALAGIIQTFAKAFGTVPVQCTRLPTQDLPSERVQGASKPKEISIVPPGLTPYWFS